MSSSRAISWVAAGLLLVPSAVTAQDADAALDPDESVVLVGGVLDRSTGEPVSSARITLTSLSGDGGQAWVGDSDESGRFSTAPLPIGGYRVEVEAASFPDFTDTLVLTEAGTVDLDIQIVPIDFELDPVIAVADRRTRLDNAGFFDRRESRGGVFISREDIAAANVIEVSDLFRAIPGVRVGSGNLGPGGAVRLRQNCVPSVVMDGIALAPPVRLNEIASPGDLEGIEVYHGLTGPIQYQSGSENCGTIMLWTRDPGAPSENLGDLLKVMAGAAFVALATLATR